MPNLRGLYTLKRSPWWYMNETLASRPRESIEIIHSPAPHSCIILIGHNTWVEKLIHQMEELVYHFRKIHKLVADPWPCRLDIVYRGLTYIWQSATLWNTPKALSPVVVGPGSWQVRYGGVTHMWRPRVRYMRPVHTCMDPCTPAWILLGYNIVAIGTFRVINHFQGNAYSSK